MRETRIIMGMPVTVEVIGDVVRNEDAEAVFDYFCAVDERFSTYKETSEISCINRGELPADAYSVEMREVLALAEETKKDTDAFFDIRRSDGTLDPSGIVKGWAIRNAAEILIERGYDNFYIEAGGDIQTRGRNARSEPWSIGIRNPFKREEVLKVLYPQGAGIATSGTAIRGQHIYNPHDSDAKLEDIVSVTVIGPDIFEADRYATAAFAMGAHGIEFIEQLPGFEGYEISAQGKARLTSGFARYTAFQPL